MIKVTNYWEKFEENSIYHIYNRGINANNIFIIEENYHFFLRKWNNLILPFFEIWAYCLMPNHFHFLVRVKAKTPNILKIIKQQGTVRSIHFIDGQIRYHEFLEDQFKRLFSSYALSFNKQQNRTGSLFQKRFKRVLIKDDYKLWQIIAYIHHNPIHHKYFKEYGEWKYCSFLAFLSKKPTQLARSKVLSIFDNDIEKANLVFIEFHHNYKKTYTYQ